MSIYDDVDLIEQHTRGIESAVNNGAEALQRIALELEISNLFREVRYWTGAACGVPNKWLTEAEDKLAAALLRRAQ